ncbi:non-ribosomal peptide synthetase [Archangium lansingense]|uniref:Amino acid adenylation domain-containing protein n=1 Tax=Archangium lansingense TaxID=2995310 RepID=A0ABT4A9E9_9BACT|nr:non-ribosomal peptide synthetase [Archangium lansinium]MCY1077884.1 amino acid adenylation domain-containing protein [Archangium lansinium]
MPLLSRENPALAVSLPDSTTFVDVLRERALLQPEARVFTFLDEAGETSITYRELDEGARAVAASLRRHLAPGDRALLLYPPGREYVLGFLGCLYAGVIAVPAYPPDPSRLARTLPRLQALVADCRATAALTTSALLDMVEFLTGEAPDLRALRWLATDAIEPGAAGAWSAPRLSSEDLAFLQYTSGSTGTPKGVMLSHRNLLHNSELIALGFDASPQPVGVIWLPPYHDMGLIGGILQPLYRDIPTVLMSPLFFLQRPLHWLEAISRHGGTVSGGPNFAYELCVRKTTPEQRAALDLRRWEVAFCGAEPIRQETLERFAEAFAPAGFRREAFYPCYGLAEGTLIVSGGRKAQAPVVRHFARDALLRGEARAPDAGHEGVPMIGCGDSLRDQSVRIVDPETCEPCAPGRIGEIWVRSASVARGYWERSEDTARIFQARLAGSGEGPYLRTGDLGVLEGGELFVTGRRKDLLIIRGRNHYPQDLELTVERCDPGLRPGCGAAFSVDIAGEERLVVVQEFADRSGADPEVRAREVIDRIRQTVAEQHELGVHAVVLLVPGSIPKTSSGKIQRHACRAAFLDGSLEAVGSWREGASVTRVETSSLGGPDEPAPPVGAGVEALLPWLSAFLSRELRIPPSELRMDVPLTRYGLDSLRAMEVRGSLELALGASLPVTALLRGPSVQELADILLVRPVQQAETPLAPQTPEETPPLSEGQRALWFLQRMSPESTAYHVVRAARIRSQLDVPALERAFQALVARHPSLRAVFPEENGAPVPRFVAPSGPLLQVEEATGWSEAQVKTRLDAEAHRPFELERGPLMRVLLLTRGPNEHVLLLALHHIITDFWSLGVMVEELGALYTAETGGLAGVLPALSPEPVEATRVLSAQLAGPKGEALRSFWKARLGGELPLLSLPTDHPRPRLQSFRGDSLPFHVGPELARSVNALARDLGATPYMVLLAAFFAFLRRYTGQDELIVGAPTAGRTRPELLRLVGYLVNPVALRASIPQGTTFRELVSQVRSTVLEALEHQDMPFTRLVEELQPTREPGHSPVFQAMFVLQRGHLPGEGTSLASFALGDPDARMRLGALEVESLPLNRRGSTFDLTLMMAETEGGLGASLEYCTDLFEASTAERMARHFVSLLAELVEAPGRRVEEVELLRGEERARVLEDWSRGPRVQVPVEGLVRLLEEQVARAPEAIAVEGGGQRLSYRELEARARRLGARLRREGVGPEVRVGVLLEKSVEAVVAFWGVQKAGGVYVPLEAVLPRDRLEWMARDAGVKAVVTVHGLEERCLPPEGARVVRLEETGAEELADLESGVRAGNAAYVLYTSGSTGRPKGVEVPHAGLCDLAYARMRAFGVGAECRLLQLASLGFDASIWEFLLTVSVGGTLYVPEGGRVPLGEDLRRVLVEGAVTMVTLPPSVLALLPEEGLEHLRVVKSVGEACPPALVEKWGRGRRFVNGYGPTETSVCVTWAECVPGEGRPSIGKPLANVQAYVLDAELRPVPPGVAGELFLGGPSMARGYVGRPELTAERFVPNPFSQEGGERLYRTGDMVRWRADGRLDYMGRADVQVKVNGVRVEPGEVESALREVGGAKQAHVKAWKSPSGEARLVAYVVPGESTPREPRELRALLRQRLPESMVPSAFVHLEALPLSSSGKVDGRALPPPEPPARSASFVPPRSPLEISIARCWAQALGREAVGLHDHFFDDLGGSSLTVVRACALLREELKRDVPIVHFFEHPTVHALARRLDPAVSSERNNNHQDRAEARRQALQRRNPRGSRGNG